MLDQLSRMVLNLLGFYRRRRPKLLSNTKNQRVISRNSSKNKITRLMIHNHSREDLTTEGSCKHTQKTTSKHRLTRYLLAPEKSYTPNSNSIGIQVYGKRTSLPESKSAISNGRSCRDSRRHRLTMRSELEFTVRKNHHLGKITKMACTRLSNCNLRGHLDIRIKVLSSLIIRMEYL